MIITVISQPVVLEAVRQCCCNLPHTTTHVVVYCRSINVMLNNPLISGHFHGQVACTYWRSCCLISGCCHWIAIQWQMQTWQHTGQKTWGRCMWQPTLHCAAGVQLLQSLQFQLLLCTVIVGLATQQPLLCQLLLHHALAASFLRSITPDFLLCCKWASNHMTSLTHLWFILETAVRSGACESLATGHCWHMVSFANQQEATTKAIRPNKEM